ncbi:MAG: YerC/YecD family TrpR-related protein [Atopobiaceae bacterium]|jgi:TrpR-related protein YerC/YecD|nr:YerC/YecD family TrpR-related protein [Atopobiaceae bacterium]MCI2172730.1 YerC/YecD family TrpR-related protein [Atopobiaceae bacterium]MCI2207037.1 YerC/YecD family TrpR-related protein [Atopobiaceae bacterium]
MTHDEIMGTDETGRLLEALCVLDTPAEARALMLDLCTPKEIEDFAQRLEVARLLDAGESYLEVQEATGASSTTVSRVSKCLNGPEGGYRIVLDRMSSADAGR